VIDENDANPNVLLGVVWRVNRLVGIHDRLVNSVNLEGCLLLTNWKLVLCVLLVIFPKYSLHKITVTRSGFSVPKCNQNHGDLGSAREPSCTCGGREWRGNTVRAFLKTSGRNFTKGVTRNEERQCIGKSHVPPYLQVLAAPLARSLTVIRRYYWEWDEVSDIFWFRASLVLHRLF